MNFWWLFEARVMCRLRRRLTAVAIAVPNGAHDNVISVHMHVGVWVCVSGASVKVT